MKTSLGKPAPPARRRITPWLCVLVNQLACPGLGTALAGRRIGYAQIVLMVVGFCLLMFFMIWYFICGLRAAIEGTADLETWRAQYRSVAWTGWWGLGLSAAAWCWAGLSSIAILRQNRSQPPPLPPTSNP